MASRNGSMFKVIENVIADLESYQADDGWTEPFVRVHFMARETGDLEIEDVVEALNTSVQVKAFTLEEYRGKFDELKGALVASKFDTNHVAFRENEEKAWHVLEIIQRLACFLKDRWKIVPPSSMYRSKDKALQLFINDEVGEFAKLYPIIREVSPCRNSFSQRWPTTSKVTSWAIMEYLMARYGPTPLAPDPHDPAFPAYQQFLHLGEAGLAASMYFVVVSRNLAPEAERRNWGASKALEVFESRLGLVTRQLARSPYLAGETFTAADISVSYALQFARRGGGIALGEAEQAYIARTSGREAYKRAMETCQATKAWWMSAQEFS